MKKIHLTLTALILAVGGAYLIGFSSCWLGGCEQVASVLVSDFEECKAAGFEVIEGDGPARCMVSDDEFYVRKSDFIKLSQPVDQSIIENDFELSGQAQVLNNQLHYKLVKGGQTYAEGSTPVNSPEHGRWGDFKTNVDISEYEFEDLSDLRLELYQIEKEELDLLKTVSLKLTDKNLKFNPLKSYSSKEIKSSVRLEVPFAPQAPYANWNAPYNEACEEISLIMTHYYSVEQELPLAKADEEIQALTGWVSDQGMKVDISIAQLASVARQYYGVKVATYYDEQVTANHLKWLLSEGYPVIIPAAGQMLNNPYFRGAGPPYHMLVLTGYEGDEFIVNDPGTKRGEQYRYSIDTIMEAIHDWNGSKETIKSGKKAILIIKKN